jgi:hypothetical protein
MNSKRNRHIPCGVSGNFSYLVGQPPVTITPHDLQWHAALPQDRRSVTDNSQPAGRSLSYGDYFAAARRFLSRDEMAATVHAAGILAKRSISAAEIDHVAIHLAKHGAFYHPAKVVVATGTERLSLVLNVALSESGRAALWHEYTALERLFRPDRPYLPRVFEHGVERIGDFDISIFAAEWLEGFCEFHLAGVPDGTLRWRVWGDGGARWELSAAQIADLYRQAAHILTAHYNPFTYESILGWHHAAGDFIVKAERKRLAVRLITVRRYAPLFAADVAETPDLETLLDGVAAFFVDLSLRMRLDRLDGVGELAWAPDLVLPAVWNGFIDGLLEMAATHNLPTEFGAAVQQFLAAHPARELEALGRGIAERYPQDSGERHLIAHYLPDHLRALGAIMRHHR